jgi:predicted transcriptional regulator
MSVGWQKLRVPLLERLVLLEIAERTNRTKEEVLREAIRELARRELLRESERGEQGVVEEEVRHEQKQ